MGLPSAVAQPDPRREGVYWAVEVRTVFVPVKNMLRERGSSDVQNVKERAGSCAVVGVA